jgi:hypothetical protein
MKIPTAAGVISVYGSQEEAWQAERNTSVHNRQVHIIDEDESSEAVTEVEQKAEAQMRQSMKEAEAERMKAVDDTRTVPLCADVPSSRARRRKTNSCRSFVIMRMCSHGPSQI